MKRTLRTAMAILFGVSLMGAAEAQDRRGPSAEREGPPHPEVTVDWTTVEQRIAWFGTLESALKAARRTGRPILLVSGAPACQAVPGVW